MEVLKRLHTSHQDAVTVRMQNADAMASQAE